MIMKRVFSCLHRIEDNKSYKKIKGYFYICIAVFKCQHYKVFHMSKSSNHVYFI